MQKTLREHRIDNLLTYRGLAEQASCSTTTLLAVERGCGARRPHFGTMVAIAKALGVEVREITEFDAALNSKMAEAA